MPIKETSFIPTCSQQDQVCVKSPFDIYLLLINTDRGNHGYYELRDAPGRGEGAFALQDLAAGTRILIDRPLMTFSVETNRIGDREVLDAYEQLQDDDKRDFDRTPAFHRSGERYFGARPADVFHCNKFSMNGGSRRGCFVYASRFNHSCSPNCDMSTNDGNMECHVLTDVAEGQELTFSYFHCVWYLPTDQRQEIAEKWLTPGARCLCSLCLRPEPERRESDSRRLRLRHLIYAWNGIDIAPEARSSIPVSEIEAEFGTPNCKQRGDLKPLREFIDTADQEGILAGRIFRGAYWEGAEAIVNKAEQAGRPVDVLTELPDLRRWTLRAEEFKNIFGGGAFRRRDEGEQSFDESIARYKVVIADLEGA